ncbi:MAG: 50S ribosomal protein L30 [Rikenellaceae bacterium]|nr:50S ribosomal protein L30 [Rikenellaceae bacterium]MCL2692602.1 50S ribosomal protein L30 [Rikenellaceae bacterium]
MAKVNITQVRSRIGATKIQCKNLDALGLRRMGRTVQHEDSPVIMGMIEKVRHLVKIEMNATVKDDAKSAAATKKATAGKKATAAPKAEAKKPAATKTATASKTGATAAKPTAKKPAAKPVEQVVVEEVIPAEE